MQYITYEPKELIQHRSEVIKGICVTINLTINDVRLNQDEAYTRYSKVNRSSSIAKLLIVLASRDRLIKISLSLSLSLSLSFVVKKLASNFFNKKHREL